MNAYIVVDETRAQYIEAPTPEEAAIIATGRTSVARLRTGVTFSIYPTEFAKKIRCQYENPNAGIDDVGTAVIRDEFVEVVDPVESR